MLTYCFYCPAGRIGPPPGLSCRDPHYSLQRVRAAAPAGYVLMPGYNGPFLWGKEGIFFLKIVQCI